MFPARSSRIWRTRSASPVLNQSEIELGAMPRFRFLSSLALAGLLLHACALAGAQVSPASYRTNLLLFHDRKGNELAVKNQHDWERRRAEILTAMQTIMGPVPGKEKHCALLTKTDSEVDRGSYVERLIRYQSEPGSRVPAYLLVPKQVLSGKGKVPAMLVLHPTDMEYGHRTVVEQ